MTKATSQAQFDESRMVVEYYRASGKGGQKRNKVETACRLKYDDLIVTCCNERSKRQNYELALKDLKNRVATRANSQAHEALNAVRKSQIGSGQRGDKIRTYRVRDDIATDHRTGEKRSMTDLRRGRWFS